MSKKKIIIAILIAVIANCIRLGIFVFHKTPVYSLNLCS